jgi:hypothetical protein
VRRKRIGVGDDSWEERLQGRVAQTLRVSRPSFRKLYDLVGDGVPCRTDRPPVSLLKGDNGHLESDAQ